MVFRDDSILPDPPLDALPIMHNREYRVQSYRLDGDRLLIQGALRDQKPPGLFVPDDPDPLTIHHMCVSIEVSVPELEIVAARTEFRTHPNETCPAIIEHYDQLVGLSIRRGFTHKVRELFGGPRGCSHTTALLQAMAPIAMQSIKAMESHEAIENGTPHPIVERPPDDESWRRLVNTCHVWSEDGDQIEARRQGGDGAQTVVVIRRLEELGRRPS